MAIHLNKRQATVFLALLTIGPVTAFTYLAIARLIAYQKAKTMTDQEQKDLAIRIARKHERDRRNNPWSEPEVTERQPTDAEILYAASLPWSGRADPNDPDNYWLDDKTGERVNAHTGERETPRERIRRRLWSR